jgi:uncharacterized protein YndB with AHSA1/START domain
VKRWFSPETFTVSDAEVQMHVGGPFEVCMRSPTGEEHWLRGRFVEIAPGARLVIDMHVADSSGKPLFRAARWRTPPSIWSAAMTRRSRGYGRR